MSKQLTSEDIQRTVLESQDDLARMLRAVAHDKRLQLLALVVEGRQEFAGLLKATGLSKTALANHLGQLLDSGLIERLERGNYQLTADGRDSTARCARRSVLDAGLDRARRGPGFDAAGRSYTSWPQLEEYSAEAFASVVKDLVLRTPEARQSSFMRMQAG